MDELNRIQYDCDTEGGSSGAAVLDTASLEIVAIHTNGTSNSYYGHNSGQPIQDIIDELKKEFGIWLLKMSKRSKKGDSYVSLFLFKLVFVSPTQHFLTFKEKALINKKRLNLIIFVHH